jgi:hypothetical protein
MSALPPKADIGERHRDVRFVPKADICSEQFGQLLDHLVGAAKKRQRDGEAESFSSL